MTDPGRCFLCSHKAVDFSPKGGGDCLMAYVGRSSKGYKTILKFHFYKTNSKFFSGRFSRCASRTTPEIWLTRTPTSFRFTPILHPCKRVRMYCFYFSGAFYNFHRYKHTVYQVYMNTSSIQIIVKQLCNNNLEKREE